MGTLSLAVAIFNAAVCLATVQKAYRDEVSLPRAIALLAIGALMAWIAAASLIKWLSPV